VTSACYDKQHVCTYLQPFSLFSHYTSQQRENNVFLEGVPLSDAFVRGEPPHPAARNMSRKTRVLGQPKQWKFRDSSLNRFDTIPQCDGRTDVHFDDG